MVPALNLFNRERSINLNRKLKKRFKAIVFDDDKQCYSIRVELEAFDIDGAIEIINDKYGKDKYIDLHSEEDADMIR